MNRSKALLFATALAVLGTTTSFAQTLEPVDPSQEDQIADKATTLPAAPASLHVQAVSTTRIALLWQDNSNNESEFQVEGRPTGGTTFAPLGTVSANVPRVYVVQLDPNTAYDFRVRASNNVGNSGYTNIASATTMASDGPCAPTASAMCLSSNRFRVQAMFLTPQGQNGDAHAVKLTTDSGYLWFFSDTNIEAIVKVLNACTAGTGNRYWVFAGGLTNVSVFLSVTDTAAAQTRGYPNPQGLAFQPIQDTQAFATCQ